MLDSLLNLLFPPQCLSCDVRVPTHGTLCLSCWQGIEFITDPVCDCCGIPFDYNIGKNALCGLCLKERPEYAHARSAFRYDDNSNKLVTRFKYSDQTALANIYGKWLAKAAGEIFNTTDFLIPVPLYYWRFVGRRYNQSAMLAHSLSKITGIKHLPDALKRTRHTTPQTGLSLNQRRKNVQGAFIVRPSFKDTIKGKNILLIDDVLTTGSTVRQCTKVLLKNGAAQVNVLTLARTVR